MENQTKYRILGILVIVGLVIILMPLFQNSENKQVSQNETIEQQVQEVALNEVSHSQSIPQETAPHLDDGMVDTALPDEEANKNPPVVINNKPKIITISNSKPMQKKQSLSGNQEVKIEPITTIKNIPENHQNKKSLQKNSSHFHTSQNKSNKHQTKYEFTYLKNSSWIIQVVSYRDKVKATQLLQQLRNKGYSAFMQEISHPDRDELRIFVGPHANKRKAINLRNKINKETHLNGIIVKYQKLG